MVEKPDAHPGGHLKSLVRTASFGGLFLSLVGTLIVWSGASAFNCSPLIWEISLGLNFLLFVLTWAAYAPFKDTDRALGHGVLSIFMLLSMFWLFGFSTFYFYFIFAPLNMWPRVLILAVVTAILFYRARVIGCDIRDAFRKNQNLFGKMYRDEEVSITYSQDAFGLLQKARRNRNPFKSVHAYVAMTVAPFVFVINRLLAPILGEGHGVFIIAAFFSVPIMLWWLEIAVQTMVTTIYYPIKLQQETGKPVLLKEW